MAQINIRVLVDLCVSMERFEDPRRKFRSDSLATALEAAITVTSLQELASNKGSLHSDAINRHLESVVLET
jgi:hypothetical protein